MQLFQISEGFQDNQIDAFFVQGRNLLAKGLAGLGKRDFPQGLNAHAQGSNGAGNQRIKTLGRLPGHPGAFPVDVSQLVEATVLRQAKRIGAEGVCFNDLRSGVEVFLVDVADEIRLYDVQFVVAAVDEDPLGVQQGAHGAIA